MTQFPEPSDDVRDLITALVAVDGRIAQFDQWVQERGLDGSEHLAAVARALDGLDVAATIRQLRATWDLLQLLPASTTEGYEGSGGFRPTGPTPRFGASELDAMVERVARSDAGSLLVQDEQGPWPGTAAYEREVRDVARRLLVEALGEGS